MGIGMCTEYCDLHRVLGCVFGCKLSFGMHTEYLDVYLELGCVFYIWMYTEY